MASGSHSFSVPSYGLRSNGLCLQLTGRILRFLALFVRFQKVHSVPNTFVTNHEGLSYSYNFISMNHLKLLKATGMFTIHLCDFRQSQAPRAERRQKVPKWAVCHFGINIFAFAMPSSKTNFRAGGKALSFSTGARQAAYITRKWNSSNEIGSPNTTFFLQFFS